MIETEFMQNYDVIWRLYNFPNFTNDFHFYIFVM